VDETENWAKILINGNYGYVFKKHLIGINHKNLNIIKTIEYFLNIPYLLGGKSFMGIDCSGLIQVCLNFHGIKIPRNTVDQINYNNESIVDTKAFEKNCLVFWDGHVAILKSKNNIIHSNAYHMKVKKEALSIAKKRLENNSLIIKKIKKLNLK
jgi:cell wall-associated NlpC family hydrolase